MNQPDIINLVSKLDTPELSLQDQAWAEIKQLNLDIKLVPFLKEAYPTFKTWQGRAWLLHLAIRYARESEEATQLGIEALEDQSKVVRYRACSLLAYSLKTEALPHLEKLLDSSENQTREDAAAAINAIKSQNHNLFIDRTNSGKTFWEVDQSRPNIGE